ncbi:MAG: alpha/beta hydrolase family protein [Solirubrobacteraceae bacterium]
MTVWAITHARGAAAAAVAALAVGLGACGGSTAPPSTSKTSARAQTTTPAPRPGVTHAPFAVGVTVLRLVDQSRRIAGDPRTLVTVVRYPALGAPTRTDVRGARPATAAGPFPLVVFAHGYRLAPYTYTRLLRAWARAGYVVAAPYFPLTNADARLVDRSDLINQPQDLRFVIARLLASRGAPLQGLIDGNRIALGGHSDGVDSALAVVYSQRGDPRIRAALGFSGAEIAAFTGFPSPTRGIPLLAVQGTADSVNSPSGTYAYFAAAPRPKYLLKLLGAEHPSPDQDAQPYLGIVERVSTAFLDRYVRNRRAAGRRLAAGGDVPGRSTLQSEPRLPPA